MIGHLRHDASRKFSLIFIDFFYQIGDFRWRLLLSICIEIAYFYYEKVI